MYRDLIIYLTNIISRWYFYFEKHYFVCLNYSKQPLRFLIKVQKFNIKLFTL